VRHAIGEDRITRLRVRLDRDHVAHRAGGEKQTGLLAEHRRGHLFEMSDGRILTALLPPKPAMAIARLEPYGMLILVGLIVFDKELGIIHTITGTFAKGLSGTILSTALGLRPGVAE